MKCLLTLACAACLVSDVSACWLSFGCRKAPQSNCQPCQPQGKLYFSMPGTYPGGCQNGVCPAPTQPTVPVQPKELPPKLEAKPKPAPKELKVGSDGVERLSRAEFLERYGYDAFADEKTVVALAPSAAAESVTPSSLLAMHNATRKAAGQGPLVEDATMSAFATLHSKRQADSGRSTCFHSTNYSPNFASVASAENVFWCSSTGCTDAYAHENWVKSSGHYRNLTDPNWTKVGFGRVDGPNGAYYTAVFGR